MHKKLNTRKFTPFPFFKSLPVYCSCFHHRSRSDMNQEIPKKSRLSTCHDHKCPMMSIQMCSKSFRLICSNNNNNRPETIDIQILAVQLVWVPLFQLECDCQPWQKNFHCIKSLAVLEALPCIQIVVEELIGRGVYRHTLVMVLNVKTVHNKVENKIP